MYQQRRDSVNLSNEKIKVFSYGYKKLPINSSTATTPHILCSLLMFKKKNADDQNFVENKLVECKKNEGDANAPFQFVL